MDDHEQYEALSSRSRRKKSSVSLSCCFNGHHHRSDLLDVTSSSIMTSPSSRLLTSPSSLKGRYKSLISRMSRHRRHSSADFSYDPLSYSLNFEDNDHHHDDPSDPDDFPIRSFASRLPLSPPGSGRSTFMASPWSSSSSSSSATRKTIMGPPPMQQRTPCTSSSSRAAAVAEVRKSLEEAKPREARPDSWKLEEVRTSPNIPTPTPKKVKTRAVVPESRRNIDPLTPAAAEVRRGGYEYEYEYEEVSPALVASPHSRQVLVELC